MGYLLITVYTLLNIGESIFVRGYAKKHGTGGMLMNAIIALFASLFFLITDTDGFYAPPEMIPIAIVNACLFAAGFYCGFAAYKCGPFGLTRLISSFSLLFTIFYAIFFLGETPTATTYIGIAMILASIVLINYKQGAKSDGAITPRWIFHVSVSLIANGFIGILTRIQQLKFEDKCSSEFQFISIGGSCILLAIIGIIIDRNRLPYIMKHGTLYGMLAGACNGAKNFLTIIIYTLLPLSVISPLKTGFSMIATFAMALLVYKEKYSTRQLIGVAIGAVAVLLLAF